MDNPKRSEENHDLIAREIVSRCRLMCGAEALTYNLPTSAGYLMHDSIVEDEIEGWNDVEFLQWVNQTVLTYGLEHNISLGRLYDECRKIMDSYTSLMEQYYDGRP